MFWFYCRGNSGLILQRIMNAHPAQRAVLQQNQNRLKFSCLDLTFQAAEAKWFLSECLWDCFYHFIALHLYYLSYLSSIALNFMLLNLNIRQLILYKDLFRILTVCNLEVLFFQTGYPRTIVLEFTKYNTSNNNKTVARTAEFTMWLLSLARLQKFCIINVFTWWNCIKIKKKIHSSLCL